MVCCLYSFKNPEGWIFSILKTTETDGEALLILGLSWWQSWPHLFLVGQVHCRRGKLSAVKCVKWWISVERGAFCWRAISGILQLALCLCISCLPGLPFREFRGSIQAGLVVACGQAGSQSCVVNYKGFCSITFFSFPCTFGPSAHSSHPCVSSSKRTLHFTLWRRILVLVIRKLSGMHAWQTLN